MNENAKNRLNAVSIGINAYKSLFNTEEPAYIEGVFNNSLYIKLSSNNLLRVIKNKEYMSENSILVDKTDPDFSFKSSGITEGMKVTLNNNSLSAGDKILISDFNDLEKWTSPEQPDFSSVVGLETMMLNLRILRDTIYTSPSREGLIPLLENVELMGSIDLFLKSPEKGFIEKARQGIEQIMWGIYSYDLKAIENSSKSIIGLGPGLTPSCDDFLAGLILSLKIGNEILRGNGHDGEKYFSEISDVIYNNALDKTTVFSLNMIREACDGICPTAESDLIYSLLTKEPDAVAGSSKILIKMGETSGADTAIGIFYGIRFLTSRLENLEVIDAVT